jgi:hypothetical protein
MLSGKYILGQVAADKYMQFFPNGTFIDHRVTDQMFIPSPYYLNPRNQRGTYTIQNQTMVFTFSDGHRGMITFIAPKAEADLSMFDWISLGGQQFYEEGYEMKLRGRP